MEMPSSAATIIRMLSMSLERRMMFGWIPRTLNKFILCSMQMLNFLSLFRVTYV